MSKCLIEMSLTRVRRLEATDLQVPRRHSTIQGIWQNTNKYILQKYLFDATNVHTVIYLQKPVLIVD